MDVALLDAINTVNKNCTPLSVSVLVFLFVTLLAVEGKMTIGEFVTINSF